MTKTDGEGVEQRQPMPAAGDTSFSRKIGVKEQRMLQARGKTPATLWLGFSMFGLVGWSVAVPALLGVAIGIWIDRRHPGSYSWTLMLLICGLGIGCLNAWHWIAREHKRMQDEGDENNE